MQWLYFFLSAVVIVVAGIRLTYFADKLSARFNLGQAWAGVILLGLVTSLPEAVTSFMSIVQLNAVDMAVGNLLGSNNFNPMLLVVMDFVFRRKSITNAIVWSPAHKVAGFYALGMMAVVMVDIAAGAAVHFGCISAGSILIAWMYFSGMRRLGILEKGACDRADSLSEGRRDTSTGKIVSGFILSSVCVIAAAMVLARAADGIAQQTGLGRTFVGTIFLAVVTSLPEMVVTLSAMRMGAFDMALGNIYGSNITNIFILFLCQFAHMSGPLLSAVSKTQMMTAGLSLVLVTISLIGVSRKDKRVYGGLGWDSWMMLFCFLIGMGCLYVMK